MKEGWEIFPLGEVCHLVNGGTPRTSVADYWDGDHLWITPAEMGNRPSPFVSSTVRRLTDEGLRDSSARLVPPFTVIVSTRAPIGHLVINTEPMAFNQGCKGLVPKSVLNHVYLFHYLSSITDVLNALGTGATFKELSGHKLKEVKIPVPPLSEQHRIVEILDKAFADIAKAKANAERNLQNARELFESQLNEIFQLDYRQYDIIALSELVSEVTDGDHQPPPKSLDGIPFITIGNIIKDTRQVDFSSTFKVPRSYFASLKTNRRPQRGDVLYTVTGSFGIPVLIDSDCEFCFQRHIGLIRPKTDTDSRWICYLLLSPQVYSQAAMAATGTAQKTVSLRSLRSLRVPRLPIARQQQQADQLDVLSIETQRLARIYQRRLEELEALKKSILHKTFSGEL